MHYLPGLSYTFKKEQTTWKNADQLYVFLSYTKTSIICYPRIEQTGALPY